MQKRKMPMEIVDDFRWDERVKRITRDVHRVSGLMNFTHLRPLASEPAIPMHYHRDIMEIHCVVKGCRHNRLFIRGDVAEYVSTGGEVLLVFPGECHATGNESGQAPCEVLAAQLNVAEAEDFLGLNPEKGRALCSRLSTHGARHLRATPEDLALLKRAFDLFATRDVRDQDEGLMHLVCFLYRLLKMPLAQLPLSSASSHSIRRVMTHIHENLSEPLDLAGLASLAGYSLSRFKTKFRAETGQTPAFYIATARIEQAKQALLESDRSITDIAYSLGWSSSNYFCTVFRKLTGTSPLQYRKQNR